MSEDSRDDAREPVAMTSGTTAERERPRAAGLPLAFWAAILAAIGVLVSPGITWVNAGGLSFAGTSVEVREALNAPVNPNLLYAAGGVALVALLAYLARRRPAALVVACMAGIAAGAVAIPDFKHLDQAIGGSETLALGPYLAAGGAIVVVLGSLIAAAVSIKDSIKARRGTPGDPPGHVG